MMCFERERGKRFWIKRAIFIPIAIVAGIFIFGHVVMFLWNGILPAVLGVHTITFWQALGILLLAKILFGGFHGRHGCHGFHRRRQLMEKWSQLSPEEREKLRSELRGRCGNPEKQDN
jgi:hypothetical protein